MKYLALLCTIMIFLFGCVEEKDTKTEQPQIQILSPTPCDTLYYGDNFHFTIIVTDNRGLGNVSMDLHNNFGHHKHPDHASCIMDPVKEAVTPYYNNWIFALPSGVKADTFDTTIALPDSAYDTGDYHFHIYVTDNEGYQSYTTLSVKIKE